MPKTNNWNFGKPEWGNHDNMVKGEVCLYERVIQCSRVCDGGMFVFGGDGRCARKKPLFTDDMPSMQRSLIYH